jgi:hypothetical protein
MVPSMTTILQRFTSEWAVLLEAEAILTVCRDIGYTAWRDRVLTPVTTIPLCPLQILHGNTACSHLPHLVERISFLDALWWLGAPSPGRPLMALMVNPARPQRGEPRVKKRRPKSFPFMITPRHVLRQHMVRHARGG